MRWNSSRGATALPRRTGRRGRCLPTTPRRKGRPGTYVRRPTAVVVGQVHEATGSEVARALDAAQDGFDHWSATPVAERAALLRRVADLYEEHMAEFCAIAAREAGKILLDGVAEVREAVDFLRYYAE